MIRKTLAVLAILLLCQPALPAGEKRLALEEIFSPAGLGGRLPTQMRWSPDGRMLAYILEAEKGERRDLWVVDAAGGEKRILVGYEQLTNLAPAAEKTGDERERERVRRFAVAAYLWSPDSKSILFTSAGQLYLFDLAAGKARRLAPEKRELRDPKFSPDGNWVSFVYRHDIWIAPAGGGAEKQLTTGGNDNVFHGDLDWIYPEELGVRTGYHWSPDSRRIAFLELDEHPVPTYPITDFVPIDSRTDFQRYPKPGDPNPKARVGVVEINGASTKPVVWIDRSAEYLPRITWIDAGRVAVQLLNRAQTELELIEVNAADGRSRGILVERDPNWVNVTNDLTFLSGGREFLWTSERTGFRHIYLYGRDGKLKRALTEGDWEARSVAGVDEKGGWVYYVSNERHKIGSDLYRVPLDGRRRERLTEALGTHAIVMNSQATAYLDTGSSLRRLPELAVHHLPTGRAAPVHQARSLDQFDLAEPEIVELKAADGALVRGMLLKPRNLEAGRKYPALMYVYGGPHAPVIRDAWGASRYLYHQYLVQQGFVVFYADDRASSILGHKYETALGRNFGPTALADHRVAVAYLRALPFVDPQRIGVWGWSGGGFSACFALTHSDLFKVGIAVAAVTDWRLYDSIYTERYMGLPQEQPEAYRKTSAIEAAGNLHGRLLLVHGTSDDNVHPQNSLKLIHALIEAGKPYDLLLYPQKTHSISGPGTQLHLHRAMAEYLKEHL